MPVSLQIKLAVGDEFVLWNEAVKHGYSRDDETKRWRDSEIREAARWMIKRYIHSLVEKSKPDEIIQEKAIPIAELTKAKLNLNSGP